MALFLHHGQAIFFAHVPKAGGTSVEDYLIRRLGQPGFLDSHKRLGVRGTGLIAPASHLSAQDLGELLPPNLDLCFAMVRDPVERLKSEYRYQTGSSRSSRLSFSTWLRLMLAALRLDRRIYENHIRPQAEMVPEHAEFFRLEDDGMTAIVRRIDEVTGSTAREVVPEHMNKRTHEPMTLYREDVDLIMKVYAQDYERFGYPEVDRAQLPSDGKSALRNATAAVLAPALVARQRWRWSS